MTVVAWDGKTLAADKQSTASGYAAKVTKVHRVPQGLVGFAGDGPHAMAILAWFRNGAAASEYPVATSADEAAYALLISHAGEVRCYSGGRYEIYEDPFMAFGSGRDYALAAMYLGKTAREAVEVANALDVFCGNGIDSLTLSGQESCK